MIINRLSLVRDPFAFRKGCELSRLETGFKIKKAL